MSCSLHNMSSVTLSVDIGRPLKFSIPHWSLKRSVCFLDGMCSSVLHWVHEKNSSALAIDKGNSDKTTRSSSTAENSVYMYIHALSISSSQVLVEFGSYSGSPSMASPPTGPKLWSGLVAGIEALKGNISEHYYSGSLTIDGAQLVHVVEGKPGYIVSPTQLNASIQQHLIIPRL